MTLAQSYRDNTRTRCTSDPNFAAALIIAHVTKRWASGESVRLGDWRSGSHKLAYLKNDDMFVTFNLAHTNALGYVTATDTLDVAITGLHGWRVKPAFRQLAANVTREYLRYHGAGL